jgi:DNA-binding CsgD family transcriptional regulator
MKKEIKLWDKRLRLTKQQIRWLDYVSKNPLPTVYSVEDMAVDTADGVGHEMPFLDTIIDPTSIKEVNTTRLKALLGGLTPTEVITKFLVQRAKTRAQKQILALLCDGMTVTEIAKNMRCSRQYVSQQVRGFVKSFNKEDLQAIRKFKGQCDAIMNGDGNSLFVNLL